MKRVSKYAKLVGQVVNGVMVVDYARLEKTSKASGKKYYSYRLWITADGEHMIEISTSSWNKRSFMKRLAKVTTEWIYGETIQTEFGWVTEEEYERIKASGRAKTQALKEEQEQQEREWREGFEEWKQQKEQERKEERFDTEIDFLMEQAYRIKESIKERAERWMDINFENVSFCGAILFDSPEKRIAFVNSIMDDNSNDIFGIIHANEWRTEHKAKFEARIYNSWDRIWKRTQKEWEAFQEKRNGANWKESWERQNSRQAINGRDDITTKFDDDFKDCTDTKQVKRIYRKLAKTFHSDLGGDDQLMVELNKAYDKWLIKIGDGSKVAKTEEQAKQDAKEEDYKFWWQFWEELVDYDYDTFRRVMEYEAHPVYIA